MILVPVSIPFFFFWGGGGVGGALPGSKSKNCAFGFLRLAETARRKVDSSG